MKLHFRVKYFEYEQKNLSRLLLCIFVPPKFVCYVKIYAHASAKYVNNEIFL